MKGGMGGIMRQVQQMQTQMAKAQEEIKQMEVTGEAGGGLVKVTVNGQHEARRVELDDSLFDDKEMLEDLIAAAFNDANKKVEAVSQEKMGGLTSGMNLPPGMNLPF